MKSLFLLIVMLFLFVFAGHAQNKVDNAVNRANGSVTSVGNSATNVSATATNTASTIGNTATQAKDVVNKFGTLFGKKHMASDDVVNTTEISFDGANFATLKKINESIKGCTGVQDSKLKFNATQSIITVTHTGSTDKLFALLEKKSPELVNDNEIVNMEDGKIALKLK